MYYAMVSNRMHGPVSCTQLQVVVGTALFLTLIQGVIGRIMNQIWH